MGGLQALRRLLGERRPEQLHLWAATSLFTVAVLVSGVGLDPRILTAAAVLGLVAVGLPHGQFDWRAARDRLSPRLGRSWPAAFLIGYLSLAAVTLIAWVLAPEIAFLVFLGCSIAHFGLEDLQAGAGAKLLPNTVVLGVRGAAPFVVPSLTHPAGVAWWIAEVTGGSAEVVASTIRSLSPWVGTLWAAAAFALLSAYIITRRRAYAAEWGAAAVVLAVLPPVYGFLLWFLVAHSPRHLIQVARAGVGEPRGWLVRELALGGLVSTMVLAVLAALASCAPVLALKLAVAGLAAVTVPHLITCAMAEPGAINPLRQT